MNSNPNATSPFAETTTVSSRPRFSVASLLMIMVVFSSVSAAMSFAMAIPQFRAEVNAWFGRTTTFDSQKPDRALQFAFLIFCYSSPLLMAGFVGLLSYVIQKFTSWRVEDEEAE